MPPRLERIAGLLEEIADHAAPVSTRCAEIGVRHLFRGAQLRRRAFHHDAAVGHHIGAVGDIERRDRVLLDEEDRQAAAP